MTEPFDLPLFGEPAVVFHATGFTSARDGEFVDHWVESNGFTAARDGEFVDHWVESNGFTAARDGEFVDHWVEFR